MCKTNVLKSKAIIRIVFFLGGAVIFVSFRHEFLPKKSNFKLIKYLNIYSIEAYYQLDGFLFLRIYIVFNHLWFNLSPCTIAHTYSGGLFEDLDV